MPLEDGLKLPQSACLRLDTLVSNKNSSDAESRLISLPWLAYVKLNNKTTLKLFSVEKVLRRHVQTCLLKALPSLCLCRAYTL